MIGSRKIASLEKGIVTDGLVLHLDAGRSNSYPGFGTTWYDLSGHGHDGALKNGPVFDTEANGCLLFDYANDYVSTNGMASHPYPHGITVSIWHNNGGGTGPYRGVVTNGNVADRMGGFDLRYGREDYYGGPNNGTSLLWRITNASGISSSTRIYSNRNEWHSYVGVYDNSAVKVFKDGMLFNSINHSAGGQLKIMPASTTIGLSPGTGEYLDGKLAQVTIYNRALTPQEIQQNFNATRGRYGI